jgi:Mce-associated membrane protein
VSPPQASRPDRVGQLPDHLDTELTSGSAITDTACEPGSHPSAAGVAVEPTVPQQHGGAQWWCRVSLANSGLSLLAIAALVSVALAGLMYVRQCRLDQQTGPGARTAALTAATEGSVALLSYAPQSLVVDLAAAKSHLTGEFLAHYGRFTDEVLAPAAQQQAVKTVAAVTKAAISEMHLDSAVVLLFIDQTTTSLQHPVPEQVSSSVMVTVNNIKGQWLIAKFEPV